MSNKKNSPIVESTVVKGRTTVSDSKSKTQTKNNNNETSPRSNTAHYDSIAELKKATEIVDADGNPIDDNSKNSQNDDQAQKKAKIKEFKRN